MVAERSQDIEELIARMAIQKAIGSYARGVDRNDPEIMRAAFHSDARLAMGTASQTQSVDQFIAGIQGGWERFRAWGMHYTMNQTIDLDGDTAHSETYYLAVMKLKDGCEPPAFLPKEAAQDGSAMWWIGGRYNDRLEKRDGEWRIAVRLGSLEWLMKGDTSATPPMLDMIGDIARRDRSDPSYERPLIR